MTDRENVISELESSLEWCQPDDDPNGSVAVKIWAAREAVELLKEQKAKTGKWIEQTDYMGDTYYDCSVCNESWITIEGSPWVNGMNYCPHCGAKMEGR